MSIQITCPNCGKRSLEEFIYGEVLNVPDSITDIDERDLARAFMHDNHEGPVKEQWFHSHGCRRWIKLHRDTRNDHIL